MKKYFLVLLILFSTNLNAEPVSVEDSIIGLYVGYYNRAPDKSGFDYWLNQANTTGSATALKAISKGFSDAPQFSIDYPSSLSSEEFVIKVYRNILNREPEEAGKQHWKSRLDSGVSKNDFMVELLDALLAYEGSIDEGLKSKEMLVNKLTVAREFINTLGNASNGGLGTTAYSRSIDVLSNITENSTTVTTAITKISQFCNDGITSCNSNPVLPNTEKGLGGLVPTEEMLAGVPTALPPVSSYTDNQLPSSYDLSNDMPPVRSQGAQGSCASWAVGYYLKGYHEHLDKQTQYGSGNDFSGAYSPAFLYNTLKTDPNSCNGGSYIHQNLQRVRDIGTPSWSDMPYNENNCTATPSGIAKSNAKCAKILDYQRIRIDQPIRAVEMQDMKYYLSHNNPLVIGIYVYEGFSNPQKVNGEYFYKDYNEVGSGAHAIVVVGYDDNRHAFKIINSWGKNWGNNGFLWIDYDVFKRITFVAYRTEDAKDECEEGASFLSIDKQLLTFNAKPINSSYKQTLTLSNSGSQSFDVYSINTPNGYSVDWNSGTINAGKSQTITVTFTPTEDKSYNGKITVSHNANKGKGEVELTGSGMDQSNPNQPPTAKAGEDTTIKVGESVKFDASNSSDSDGSIASYEWKIGDLFLSTDKSFSKSDFNAGTYRITLKVTDDKGLSDTDTVVVVVSDKDNLAPIANAGNDIFAKVGETVRLSSNSVDNDGEIVAYEWKSDGTLYTTQPTFLLQALAGKHTFTLKITDDKGATDTDIVIVTIAKEENTAPIANAGSNMTIKVGASLHLDASKSHDNDGAIRQYSWKLSGSNNNTTYNISMSSNQPVMTSSTRLFVGTYTATLTVTDNDGQKGTDSITVTVIPNEDNSSLNAYIGTSGNDVIDGGLEDDKIEGLSGNDVIDGGLGDDIINGGSGNDVIDGGLGDDVINGGSGSDVIDGGLGQDTAIFNGNHSDYLINKLDAFSYSITDKRNFSNITILEDIEIAKFNDKSVSL